MSQITKLSNGTTLPTVGLGTLNAAPKDVYNAVKYAIEEAGYRHIDCALLYENEDEVGEAINELIQKGVVKREDLFITSKCWSTFHSRERVLKCCKQSLSKLNLDYVDLYLIHWPTGLKEGAELLPKDDKGMLQFSDVDYVETWQGIEDCYFAGYAKSIGVSNFNSEQIKRIMDTCRVKPVMNQVECHAYLNQSKLIEFCKSQGIHVTAYSPLGCAYRREAYPNEPLLVEDMKLKTIAARHNKSVAQILVRYQVQRGVVVIPKSVKPERIAANIQVFDFELSTDEMNIIDDLNRNHRFHRNDKLKTHQHYPFHIPY